MAEETIANSLGMNEDLMSITHPPEEKESKLDHTIPKLIIRSGNCLVLPSPSFYSLDFSSLGMDPNVKPSHGVDVGYSKELLDGPGNDIPPGHYNVTAPYFLGSDGKLTLDPVEKKEKADTNGSRKRPLEEVSQQARRKKIPKTSSHGL